MAINNFEPWFMKQWFYAGGIFYSVIGVATELRSRTIVGRIISSSLFGISIVPTDCGLLRGRGPLGRGRSARGSSWRRSCGFFHLTRRARSVAFFNGAFRAHPHLGLDDRLPLSMSPSLPQNSVIEFDESDFITDIISAFSMISQSDYPLSFLSTRPLL